MTNQKIDVEGILNTASAPTLLASGDEAMEIFELETLADALESFVGELSDSIDAALDQAVAGALKIYYAAEAAKDPLRRTDARKLSSRLRNRHSGEVSASLVYAEGESRRF